MGQTELDLVVDGLAAVEVPVDATGEAFAEYSSAPVGAELPFPLSFPPVGSGSSIGSNQIDGHIVQHYVI
jgi:hypothetical protein